MGNERRLAISLKKLNPLLTNFVKFVDARQVAKKIREDASVQKPRNFVSTAAIYESSGT
jgi:hypothetical protein